MNEYQVTCINKRDRMSAHEHITHIGNITNAEKWRMTREEAIKRIDAQTAAFYTCQGRIKRRPVWRSNREPLGPEKDVGIAGARASGA